MIDYYEAHQIESTRKEHRCFECQKTILAASRCHILTAFSWGIFTREWFHLTCLEPARRWLVDGPVDDDWRGQDEVMCEMLAVVWGVSEAKAQSRLEHISGTAA